ncbi:hypothetical protein HRbin15_02708 [bacterium HR15]|nr:hypothetical protein HRbin15_02708 [bacterium HR15]
MRPNAWSWTNGARFNRRALVMVVWLALGWLLGATTSLNAQTLTWLGTLPGGGRSYATGVSVNGGVVVGVVRHSIGQDRAFRWTPSSGMVDLGILPGGDHSAARGVSENGNVVVGSSTARYIGYTSVTRAFRWTPTSGMQDLGTFPGADNISEALGVSPDGGWYVGWSRYWNRYGSFRRAFVANGSIDQNDMIGTLRSDEYGESEARAASRNASVVVGWAHNHLGERWAFYWVRATRTMYGLYPLAACCGEATGISENGLVIVGRSHSAQTEQWHACLWWWNVSGYSPSDLGTLGGDESEALACTNNQIVVGWSHIPSGQRRAFRWTPTGGMEDLSSVYASLLGSGSYLEIAYAITPDGRYIVGQGYNAASARTEAFLLDTLCQAHNGDVDNNGCVDDADLLAVLFAFGNTGQLGRVDTNCDQVVDDADLLQVLFNFGSGC